MHLATGLGSVSTLAGLPRTTSHVETSPEERAAPGIPENLIRYSVGIDHQTGKLSYEDWLVKRMIVGPIHN